MKFRHDEKITLYIYIWNNDDELIRNYLESVYNTVLLKDVVSKNNIKGKEYLKTGNKYYGSILENIIFLEIKRRNYDIYRKIWRKWNGFCDKKYWWYKANKRHRLLTWEN